MRRILALTGLLAASGCGLELGSSTAGVGCPDSPATDVFDKTVCVCEDFKEVGNLIVGTSVATDQAILAVNGHSLVINNTQVRGTHIPYGGLKAYANVQVTESILSAGDVDAIGNVEAGADLDAGGDLLGIGRLKVDGTLRVAGRDAFIGYKEVAAVGPYTDTPEPPCGCAPEDLFDVVAAVAQAREANDNAAVGLPTSIANIGYTRLQLGSGTYFFDDMRTIGATKILVDGNVAIYVEGNLEHVGAEWIRLAPGATLDLYVSGAVRTIGHVSLGDKTAPSAFRLYIGGEEETTLNVGNNLFNGAIYAPLARLVYIGNTKVRGAITAREITGIGNLVVGYAAPAPPPDSCEPPDADDPGDDEDDPGDDDEEDPIVIL
jgi:hypothetical protein